MEASPNALLQVLDFHSQIFQAISSLSFQPSPRCAESCPKLIVSDASLASSVTDTDKLHSPLQLLEWFQSLSVRCYFILLFALQFFLLTLGFMYIQRSSYVLSIQIKKCFLSVSELKKSICTLRVMLLPCLFLDIQIKNKFLNRSEFQREFCTSQKVPRNPLNLDVWRDRQSLLLRLNLEGLSE